MYDDRIAGSVGAFDTFVSVASGPRLLSAGEKTRSAWHWAPAVPAAAHLTAAIGPEAALQQNTFVGLVPLGCWPACAADLMAALSGLQSHEPQHSIALAETQNCTTNTSDMSDTEQPLITALQQNIFQPIISWRNCTTNRGFLPLLSGLSILHSIAAETSHVAPLGRSPQCTARVRCSFPWCMGPAEGPLESPQTPRTPPPPPKVASCRRPRGVCGRSGTILQPCLPFCQGVAHLGLQLKDVDWSGVIATAKASPGFLAQHADKPFPYPAEHGIKRPAEYTIGFGHEAIIANAGTVLDEVKKGNISRFFLVGGCDGSESVRSYFTDVGNSVPDSAVILTLGCGKYRVNHLDKGLRPQEGLEKGMAEGGGQGGKRRIVCRNVLSVTLNTEGVTQDTLTKPARSTPQYCVLHHIARCCGINGSQQSTQGIRCFFFWFCTFQSEGSQVFGRKSPGRPEFSSVCT